MPVRLGSDSELSGQIMEKVGESLYFQGVNSSLQPNRSNRENRHITRITIFQQVWKLIGKNQFDRIVENRIGDKGVRRFNAWLHSKTPFSLK
jgi:hypothetical protein